MVTTAQIIEMALAGVYIHVKWTIKPPLCALKDGRFASSIYFDANNAETQLCAEHYAHALKAETAARTEVRLKKERLAKLEAEVKVIPK